MNCAMIILAGAETASAGLDALRPREGGILANHLARLALACGGNPVLRVLGARAVDVAGKPAPDGAGDVFTLFWSRGAGAYAARGLQAALVLDSALAGVVILPCAGILPTAHALRTAAQLVTRHPDALVEFVGMPPDGHVPFALGRAHFPELLASDGPDYGRRILQRHPARWRLPCGDEEPAVDPVSAKVRVGDGFLSPTRD
jgi:hypothetical protein